MKKILLSLILTLCFGMIAWADGVYFDYCDGKIASSATTFGSTNSEIELAIRIPASILATYKGNDITKVAFGIPTTATGMPTSITAWVRVNDKYEDDITTSTVTPQKGWQDIELSTPYTITGDEEEIWVGVRWQQGSVISNIVSYAGSTQEDGCWGCKKGAWTNNSGKGAGSYSIRAYIEGNVPQRNLVMNSLTPAKRMYNVGSTVKFSGEISNKGVIDAIKPVINWTLTTPKNNTLTGTKTYASTLGAGVRGSFTLSIPTDDFTEEGTYTVNAEVVWPDNSADDYPEDNTLSATVELSNDVYERVVVAEEGTGAWCGYCVHGIVAMRTMNEKYPDSFIGLAVHNGDSYAIGDTYLDSRVSTYPACIVNRNGTEINPTPTALESAFNKIDRTMAEAKLATIATCTDGKTIEATTDVTFALHSTGRDYRIIYVLCEDKLALVQTNYYAGGSLGVMGGFESLGQYATVNVDDVVRGFFPSNAGLKGKLPANVEKGMTSRYNLSFALPKTTANAPKVPANVWLCTLLVDGDTNEILQACKTHEIYGYNAETPEGIGCIRSDNYEKPGVTNYYEVNPFVVIKNGKKILKH